MLDGQNLTVSAGRHTLLSDVSCSIAPGRVMAIIGPNGAGKTTLMRCLTGETKPDAGQVTLDGHDIGTLSPARLAVRRAVLTQKSVLSFPFSVSEVVNLGLHANATTGHERARIVGDALARVGLTGYESRFYQLLSGGEQQRVQLARVLCQVWQPETAGVANYLLLDEPIASLDIRHQIDVLRIARDFAEQGGGVAIILHDINLAFAYADSVSVLGRGKLVTDGAPEDVLSIDLLQAVFGLSRDMARQAGLGFVS